MTSPGEELHRHAAEAENAPLAASLREFADLLELQGADGFRIRAYQRAADTVGQLHRPVAEILTRGGREALAALPAIGRSIAAALSELLSTGHWSQLERLRGATDPENLFRTISGIGPKLAGRLSDDLHIDTLEALELAAYDGRLERIEGFGPRRVQMVRTALTERLGRPRTQRLRQDLARPTVAMLLDVDREYREKAREGRLHTIAPKRFNPKGVAWLPILHTRRGPWHFTAFFSNTRRAHELGRTRDWVIIFYNTAATPEGQCTIVTETRGPQTGRRVVRGREGEADRQEASRPYVPRHAARAMATWSKS